MKKYRLLVLALGTLVINIAFSQEELASKAIYKWELDGLVHYSYIRPINVKNFTKLDANGRELLDYTAGFGTVAEIVVRPAAPAVTASSTSSPLEAEEAKNLAENQQKFDGEKKCRLVQKNLELLTKGEVYEPDSKGNMVRLTKDKIESKLRNTQKDLDYFCK
ncbi:MAG: hypothetical protein ACWIPH_09205 [Ostreibacterium sp.]